MSDSLSVSGPAARARVFPGSLFFGKVRIRGIAGGKPLADPDFCPEAATLGLLFP